MKRAILAATALMSSTILSTPAFAVATDTPTAAAADSTTTANMQSQCNALAAAHDTANGDIWTAAVLAGAVTSVAGPTETGTRTIDQNSIQPTGTYVPSVKEIRTTSPYKNGGSVNLFGDQWSTAGYYPGSTYNYTASFNSTFAHAFTCDISQAVYHPAVFHPAVVHPDVIIPGAHHDAVFHPAVPVQGYYINFDNGKGNGVDNDPNDGEWQKSCEAHNAEGPAFGQWGQDTNQCKFIKTADAQAAYTTAAYDDPDIISVHGWTDPAYTDPAYNDPAQVVGNEAGIAVNQDETDTLNGYEANGPVLQVTAERFEGQVVICNSPGSKGGAWRTQNGYGGGSLTGSGTPAAAGCNTPWFKIAPTMNGTTTSQGTFTSVPNYHL